MDSFQACLANTASSSLQSGQSERQIVFKRFYRLEPLPGDQHWKALRGATISSSKASVDGGQKLRNEYALQVFAVQQYYSFSVTEMEALQDGSTKDLEVKHYFQILDMHTDGHRPKVVQTHDVDEQLFKQCSTVVQIQPLALWKDNGGL